MSLPDLSDHACLLTRLRRCVESGGFAGRKITLYDPDDATGRTRNVYEDMDFEGAERAALVTLFPEHAIGVATGNETNGLRRLSHAEALRDMMKMIEQFGYKIHKIERDIF